MDTITVYRLQKTKHIATILLGEGALRNGGRWNTIGTPLVYGALSTSLAILELAVHLGSMPFGKYPPLTMFEIEVPKECIRDFDTDELPVGWNSVPAPECSHQFLAPFLELGQKLAFSVPSAVNSSERNVLINPLHADISRVYIREFYPFIIDSRLFKEVMV